MATRSKSARCLPRKISAKRSPPSCASRKSGCGRRRRSNDLSSFRGGSKSRTSDAQLRIGESRDCSSRFRVRFAPRNDSNKDTTMRFMMLMIPLGYETAPPDVHLDPERVKAMMKYNEALKEAGVLIALDGLHPPSMGARGSFATGKPVVTDGPFTEAKEVL